MAAMEVLWNKRGLPQELGWLASLDVPCWDIPDMDGFLIKSGNGEC